tara:strand:+ start:212 stop:1462 length:1251 start_codon:yes stop_codon:yes gene_type:complete
MKELKALIKFKKNYSKQNYNKVLLSRNFNFIISSLTKILTIGQENLSFEKFLNQENINKLKNINRIKDNDDKITNYDGIIIIDIENLENHKEILNYINTYSKNNIKIICVNIYTKKFNIMKLNKFDLVREEIITTSSLNSYNWSLPVIMLNNLIFRYLNKNHIYVFEKKFSKPKIKKNTKISIIVPCKNEEGNIQEIYSSFKNLDMNLEIIFGDDKSTDNTKNKILNLKSLKNFEIKFYDGPNRGKSQNVYKGLDIATGDIVCIYDADRTINVFDIKNIISKFIRHNWDFVNCSRMILKQEKKAMKFSNYLGNIFFAKLFSFILNKKISDTLCGTKIFYKEHWQLIKKTNSQWGKEDLWGDFDLLLGCYISNLKIKEIPIKYYERKEGVTKMKNVLNNGIRMLVISITAIFKIKIL